MELGPSFERGIAERLLQVCVIRSQKRGVYEPLSPSRPALRIGYECIRLPCVRKRLFELKTDHAVVEALHATCQRAEVRTEVGTPGKELSVHVESQRSGSSELLRKARVSCGGCILFFFTR